MEYEYEDFELAEQYASMFEPLKEERTFDTVPGAQKAYYDDEGQE